MRIVDEIDHPRIKITVFQWNGKYIVKLETGQFEQSFKVSETDVDGLEDIRSMLTEEFLLNCQKQFSEMSKNWKSAFLSKNTKENIYE